MLDEAHHEMVGTVADLLRAEYEEFSLYLTGSLSTGLGSPTSDLDLVAVVPAADDDQSFADRDFAGRGGFTCDLQTVTRGRFMRWLGDVRSWQSTAKDYANVFALRTTLRNLTRLVIGTPLLGEQWLRARRADLDMRAYQRAYIAMHLADAATFVRDTAGFLASGDALTAWETSTRATRTVAEAALGAGQNVNYSGKFLLRRIQTDPYLVTVGAELWRALYQAPTDARDRPVAMARRRRLVGDLAAFVYLFGWEPGRAQRFHVDLDRPTTGIGRCPDDIIVRAEDGAVVVGRHARSISTASGLVWCLADGARGLDEIVTDFGRALGRPAADVRAWVVAEVESLTEVGLLDPPA
jgi:hypothetical protein